MPHSVFTGDGHCPAPCTVADAESNLLPVPLHLALPPTPPLDLRQAGLILLCRAASEREGGARVLGARQDCVRVLGAREGGARVLPRQRAYYAFVPWYSLASRRPGKHNCDNDKSHLLGGVLDVYIRHLIYV